MTIPDQSRKEFETWVLATRKQTQPFGLIERSGEGYLDLYTQKHWEAWQAARGVEREAPVKAIELLPGSAMGSHAVVPAAPAEKEVSDTSSRTKEGTCNSPFVAQGSAELRIPPMITDRCELPRGHQGRHKQGNATWGKEIDTATTPAPEPQGVKLTAEQLAKGIVTAAIELAVLRGNLCFEDSPPIVVEECAEIITDTWNAMQGIDTRAEEPCKELVALRAALAASPATVAGASPEPESNSPSYMQQGSITSLVDALNNKSLSAESTAFAREVAEAVRKELNERTYPCGTKAAGPDFTTLLSANEITEWRERAQKVHSLVQAALLDTLLKVEEEK